MSACRYCVEYVSTCICKHIVGYENTKQRLDKSVTIFWLLETQFSNSRCLCRGREADKPHRTVRNWASLILFECYLPNLAWSMVLGLPDYCGSCNPKIQSAGRGASNECPGYDTKQSDGKAPVMLELWVMQHSPWLPSLPGPLWPGVIALDRILSMGQIEVNCILMLNWIVWIRTVWLNWIA